MRLDEATYTVFDVETTGLYPYAGDKICEIGAVRIEPDGMEDTFHVMVDPERSISLGAFKVNQIIPEMLIGQPKIEDVITGFMAFIDGTVLVAYNAGFDLGFIEKALGYRDYMLRSFKTIDALKLARKLFPGKTRYNLGHLSESFGFSTEGEHRALADAVMTAKIFQRELSILKEDGVSNVEEIMEPARTRGEDISMYDRAILESLENAIQGKGQLRITYQSIWNNKITDRVIAPRQIRKGYDKLYVIAYCHLREEERNFRLDCITSAVAE
ncbi:MAG: WYL domain-containing protein [Candidatus Omnitrophica bacterium]|nr:WYL domain-containing protein [Candidatus Omnitrophota bacterium]MBU1128295.1 WYL domain-containing protein [Candidatus Omnitrophota bacterium]MBU1656916.1 WYL domain-containing protein [Candidatus Omnitrophota bacterium]MBU1784050.1 WYL domain-containing protein [Candidatus Omnitrophota bacterium]MBU1851045.1 WYL domain-containing protein [Candidatus Omnitrophota bacterium]